MDGITRPESLKTNECRYPKRARHALSTRFFEDGAAIAAMVHGLFVLVPLIAAALTLLAVTAACGEGEIPMPPLSVRQATLLREFRDAAPDGYAGGGVWMLGRWDLAPAVALAAMPSGPGNAAAYFRRLEDLYPAERELLERGGETEGARELLRAARCGECRLVPEFYPPFDNANAKAPDFVVLRTYLGALLAAAGREEESGNIEQAEEMILAGIVCGSHLARDRSNTLVSMTGLVFQLRSVREYEAFLRRNGRHDPADRARRVNERLAELLRLFYWKANYALGTLEEFVSLPVAVEIALHDADPAWRAQAAIRLASFRHGAPGADGRLTRDPRWQAVAKRALEEVSANDGDRDVRALAAWSVLRVVPEGTGERRVLER